MYFCQNPECQISLKKKAFPVAMDCPLCDLPLGLETSYNETERHIISAYPYVVAYPFQKMLDESHGRHKLDLLAFTFLNSLKYFALLTASEYFQSSLKSKFINDLFRNNLYQPSFGNWNHFIREAIKELNKNDYSWVFPEIPDSYEAVQTGKKVRRYKSETEYTNEEGTLVKKTGEGLTAIDTLINFRNKYLGHGVPLDANECEIQFNRYYPVLIDLFEGLKLFSELSMFKSEQIEVWSLMGNSVSRVNNIQKPGNQYDGHLWLQSDDGRVLDLLPFYVLPGQFTANTITKTEVLVYEQNTGSRIVFFSPESIKAETSGEVLENLNILLAEKEKEPPLTLNDLNNDVIHQKINGFNARTIQDLLKEKKVIDGIYQSRYEAEAALKGWVGALSSFFLIASQAGSGKTNLLAHISNVYAGQDISSLFIRASRLLSADLQQELYRIFNLSGDVNLSEVFKFYTQSNPLIILIDGANEHSQNIEFLRSCLKLLENNKGGAVKIVLSWRVSLLSELPVIEIDRSVIYPASENKDQENPLAANAWLLTPFDKRELEGAWEFYANYKSKTYKPKFTLSELTFADRPLAEQLANPLLLRMFLELFNNKSLNAKSSGFTNIWHLWWQKIQQNEKQSIVLSELALLLIEEDVFQIPLDKLYDHPVLGEYVRYVQIDSPYRQLIKNGELSEFFIDNRLYVSFTIEAALNYVLSRHLAGIINDAGIAIEYLEKNSRWREPLRYLLWDQVQEKKMELLIELIDDERADLDIATVPLAQASILHGCKYTVDLLLDCPTNRDWETLRRTVKYIEDAQAQIILTELATTLYQPLLKADNSSIHLTLSLLEYLDSGKANILFDHIYFSLNELSNTNEKEQNEIFNKVANFYKYSGKFDLAIEFFEKCMAISIKTSGAENPYVASIYNSMGSVWLRKGLLDVALTLYEKSLVIRLIILGAVHPEVASSYNNIGTVWHKKGDYDKAIKFYEKCQSIELKTLGAEHPNVGICYHNMGSAWGRKGEYAKAIEFNEKSLAIWFKTLGPEHPNVAATYNQMGSEWANKGDYDKAIGFYEKALFIYRKSFGTENLKVALSYRNIGDAWKNKCEFDMALKNYNNCLAINLKTSGMNGADTATTYNKIGVCLKSQLKFREAIEYFSLGFSITKTGDYPFQIAQCYEAINDKEQALLNYIASAEIRTEKIGLEKEDTQKAIKEIVRLSKELKNNKVLTMWSKKLLKKQ